MTFHYMDLEYNKILYSPVFGFLKLEWKDEKKDKGRKTTPMVNLLYLSIKGLQKLSASFPNSLIIG